jgi:cell division protein FtsB
MEAGTSAPTDENQAPAPARGKGQPANDTDDAIAGAVIAQHCIMFWVLTVLAIIVFAPCVLAPIYAETEQLLDTERKLERLVVDLADQEKRNEARIKAFKADPMVNERIIRRELNYRPEGEQVIQWSAAELAAMRVDLSGLDPANEPLPPVNPYPSWVLKLGEWLPAWPWRKLFVQSPNRELLLMMAAGLLATAFFLYGPIPSNALRRRTSA